MNAASNQPSLDIIWPRLIAIADEMATTMFRTAFSHDVVEVHDMSTGLYGKVPDLERVVSGSPPRCLWYQLYVRLSR